MRKTFIPAWRLTVFFAGTAAISLLFCGELHAQDATFTEFGDTSTDFGDASSLRFSSLYDQIQGAADAGDDQEVTTSSGEESSNVEESVKAEIHYVTAAQELLDAAFQQPPIVPAQPLVRPTPTRRPAANARRTAAFVSLASIPFMIGDTAGGSCASFSFLGVQEANVEHPTLACSRLNISENNSAYLRDRVYVSYRHFHNVTRTGLFSTSSGFQFDNDLNIDRITFGAEKTFFNDNFSLEVRVPIARELGSTVDVVLDDFDPSRNTLPLNDRDGEFGNISLIGKLRLLETERFLLSGGVGVMLPTAEDVVVNGDFDARFIVIADPVFPMLADTALDFALRVENSTVNVSPFLAWLWHPRERFFHQGFVQLDVPTNASNLRATAAGVIGSFNRFSLPFYQEIFPVALDEQGKFAQQTLARMNFGFGYFVHDNPRARFIQRVAAMLELHYTTTLQDAKIFRTEVFRYNFDNFGNPVALPVDLALGNGANRVDVLNLSLGCAVEAGNITITNGFVMPLSTGDNKPFDFEYNLQVQHKY